MRPVTRGSRDCRASAKRQRFPGGGRRSSAPKSRRRSLIFLFTWSGSRRTSHSPCLRAGHAFVGRTRRARLFALRHGLIFALDWAACALDAELPGSRELLLVLCDRQPHEQRDRKHCCRSRQSPHILLSLAGSPPFQLNIAKATFVPTACRPVCVEYRK